MAAPPPSSTRLSAAVPPPGPTVAVVEQCRVSPSRDGGPPTVAGEISLPFTFFDVLWLGQAPVERLFFYRWPDLTTTHFAASAFPRLKRALSAALRRYYPLAGRLEPPSPACDKLHIRCSDGDSVPLALAECVAADDQFEKLAADGPRLVGAFRPLVPDIPASALMALKATVFPGAGVCIGVSIRHEACDGSGFTSFVKTWSAICRSDDHKLSTAVEQPPVVDRTLISDPKGLYSLFHDYMKSLQGIKFLTVGGNDVVRSTFLLKGAHIEELRRRASAAEKQLHRTRYSCFVLACAYVGVCLLKTTEEREAPPTLQDAAYLMFVVDCRRRLRPPLPTAYLGNCLGSCFVDASRGRLLGSEGFVTAAEAIAESVAGLGEDGEVLRDAADWIPKAVARLPGRPLSVAGSPRFGVYGADFGWGRPAKVEIVGIEKTGAVALAESREEDGGVEVGLALPAPEMAKFTSLFTAGLEKAAPLVVND